MAAKAMAQRFFYEELKKIKGKKIITYESMTVRGNFDMTDDAVTTTSEAKVVDLWSQPLGLFTLAGAVTVRIFTNEKHASGLPIKRLRMYMTKATGWKRVSVDDVREAMETDSGTGAKLAPEPAVIYE